MVIFLRILWVVYIFTKLYVQASKKGSIGLRRGADTQQLGLHYRESSLSRELRAQPGALRPGDPAPDASCRDTAGRTVRLFDAFRGPHFTLLAFGAVHAETVARIKAGRVSTVRALRLVSRGERCGEHDLIDDRRQA